MFSFLFKRNMVPTLRLGCMKLFIWANYMDMKEHLEESDPIEQKGKLRQASDCYVTEQKLGEIDQEEAIC